MPLLSLDYVREYHQAGTATCIPNKNTTLWFGLVIRPYRQEILLLRRTRVSARERDG